MVLDWNAQRGAHKWNGGKQQRSTLSRAMHLANQGAQTNVY